MLDRPPAPKLNLDVAIELSTLLSPEQIHSNARISKVFYAAYHSNVLWKRKLIQHFPKQQHTGAHFRAQFINTYNHEYKHLSPGLRELFSIVKEGDLSRLKAVNIPYNLLSKVDYQGKTLLYWAYIKKHQAILDYFFKIALKHFTVTEKKIIPAAQDPDGYTLLHLAIMCNQPLTTFKTLLWEGCTINPESHHENLHLIHIASIYGRLDIVKYELQKTPNAINVTTPLNVTPIMYAVLNDHAHVVRYLAQTGADLTFRFNPTNPDQGLTALHIATQRGCTEVVRALVENNADLNLDSGIGSGPKPIHMACLKGHLEIIKLFLQKNIDLLNQADRAGQTPLIYACAANQPHIIEYLIELGADLNVRSHNDDKYDGYTPLHWAAHYGDMASSQLLLAHKIDMNLSINTQNHLKAIHIAAKKGRLEIVRLFLNINRQLLNTPDAFNQTPIMWAASHGKTRVVRYLIKEGADLTLSTNNPQTQYHGYTPLHWAAKKGKPETLQVFIDHKVDLTISTAIHIACTEGHLEIVKLLLSTNPALVNQLDADGNTPLNWALKKGFLSIARLLLEYKAHIKAINKDDASILQRKPS